MTQHQQLQKKINGIIQPDAEKLLVQGCEIVYNNKNYIIGQNSRFNEGYLEFVDCKDKVYYNKVEILGQKINLEAVLMALGTYNLSRHNLNNVCIVYKQVVFFYQLNTPPDQQPIETQKALFEIFNV